MRYLIGVITVIFFSIAAYADTLISNSTVITMGNAGVLENTNVYIRRDRIIRVGAEPPQDFQLTKEIDGSGKYLIPGLAEMHGHLPSASAASTQTEETLFLYLAGGVTTVRGMLGDPVQFEMRKAIKAGTLTGPTLYLAAPSLNGNTVSSVADGIAKTRRYHNEGWDLLKIHPGLSLGEYNAIARTANQLGLPFGGHVPADVGIERALEAGQTSIDHLDGFLRLTDDYNHAITSADIAKIVAVYKAHKPSWIVPTQALFNILIAGGDPDTLAARPENIYMPVNTRASWDRRLRRIDRNQNVHASQNRQKALRALAVAGARIVMGSDAPQLYSVPGFSLKREVEVMLEAGFTADEILKISTRNAGDYFADKDTFGQIAKGMRADLLLLDADPRVDALNLFQQSGVMAAGRWYSRQMIESQLAKIAARNN